MAHHDCDLLVAERVVVVLGRFIADQRAADHQVHVPVVEQAEQTQAGVLDDLEGEFRMRLPQLLERRYQHIRHRTHNHADRQAAAAAGADAGHFLAHCAQVGHQLPGMPDHAMAEGIGAHAAPGALE
ncbi:hypothetical protein D3C72_1495320 [compost metagenome]